VADLAVACLAGFAATLLSDRVQRALYRVTPQAEKRREPAYPGCSSAEQAARMSADALGMARTQPQVAALKTLIHYGLGAGWAASYPALRRGIGWRPLAAGAASGVALSILVDETLCPALGITAPNHAYPASAHARGFATHLVYGIAVAAAAEALYRLLARRNHFSEDSPTVSAA